MDKEKQINEMAMLMSEGARPAIEDAIILYEKGYRKQNDVAEQIFDDIDVILAAHRISHFENLFDDKLTDEITELKKKYTEEQK